jgi:hypothetical protein
VNDVRLSRPIAFLVLGLALPVARAQGWARVADGPGRLLSVAAMPDGGSVLLGDRGGTWLMRLDAAGAGASSRRSPTAGSSSPAMAIAGPS